MKRRDIYLVVIASMFCFCLIQFSVAATNVDLIGRTEGRYNAVVVQGNYAYIAQDNGLSIINITEPDKPQVISTLLLSTGAQNIAIGDSTAYLIGRGKSGITNILSIIDISNSLYPYTISSSTTLHYAYDIAVNGNYAYIAEGDYGLQIIDISDTAHPKSITVFNTNTRKPIGIAISGNIAYLADKNGMQVVDISNPVSPTHLAVVDITNNVNDIAIQGNYAYLATASVGLKIIDISFPASPQEISSLFYPGAIQNISVNGDYTYLATDTLGLRIVNISSPSNPQEEGYYPAPNKIKGVMVKDSHAYVAMDNAGLRILDISNKSHLTQVGLCQVINLAGHLVVKDAYAYVAGWTYGLQVIDLSNPARPVMVGVYTTLTNIVDIAIKDTYAYLAADTVGLIVLDINNPEKPIEISRCPVANTAYDIAIQENYAYIADGNSGLMIIDISNPLNPVAAGRFDGIGARAVAVRNDYAYVVDGQSKLYLINISNPKTPYLVSTYPLSFGYYVAARKNYIYTGGYSQSLSIINVWDPAHPSQTGKYHSSSPMDISLAGDYAYIACGNTGLRVVNIASPNNPFEAGYYTTPDIAVGIDVEDPYIYLGTFKAGLMVLKFNEQALPMHPIPDVKLFLTGEQNKVFKLNRYLNQGGAYWTWSAKSAVTNIAIDTDTWVDYLQPYIITSTYWIITYTAQSIGKDDSYIEYASYLFNRFPDVLFDDSFPVANTSLNLSNYVSKFSEVTAAPYFAILTTRYDSIADTTKLKITLNNNILQITPNSSAGIEKALRGPAQIAVTVKPNPNFYDIDYGLIRIYEIANSYGQFTISSDTSHWYFEPYGNSIYPGVLSWDSTDGYCAITQSTGQKAKLSQIFSVPEPGWHTATIKVATDISELDKQQKVVLYLHEFNQDTVMVSATNQVIYPGNGGFDNTTGYRQMQISVYAKNTILGVQLIVINPKDSGIGGSLYLDNFWVYPKEPEVEQALGVTKVALPNLDFESGIDNWILEPYTAFDSAGIWLADWSVLALSQFGGEKGKASYLFSLPTAGNNASAAVYVYNDAAFQSQKNIQKIYLSLYSYDSGYTKIIESGNLIIYPGSLPTKQWCRIKLAYSPPTANNAIQLVGINPNGNSWSTLYFDGITIDQDQDLACYWDHTLF